MLKAPEQWCEYRALKNVRSKDGLPGVALPNGQEAPQQHDGTATNHSNGRWWVGLRGAFQCHHECAQAADCWLAGWLTWLCVHGRPLPCACCAVLCGWVGGAAGGAGGGKGCSWWRSGGSVGKVLAGAVMGAVVGVAVGVKWGAAALGGGRGQRN